MTMKGFGIVDPNILCPLLHESFRGKTGMYSHHNNCTFPKIPELKNILMEHCFQDKYVYNPNGILVILLLVTQVLTLHKRVEWESEIIAKRVLHRITFIMIK